MAKTHGMTPFEALIETTRGEIALAVQTVNEPDWRAWSDVTIAILDPSDAGARLWLTSLDEILGTNMVAGKNPAVVPIPTNAVNSWLATLGKGPLSSRPIGHIRIFAMSMGTFHVAILKESDFAFTNGFKDEERQERRELFRRLQVTWSARGIGKTGRPN